MWEIATREHPFAKVGDEGMIDDKPQLRNAILDGQRPSLENSSKLFGPSFSELIAKCWAANPKDRPTIEEIVPKLVSVKNNLVDLKSHK